MLLCMQPAPSFSQLSKETKFMMFNILIEKIASLCKYDDLESRYKAAYEDSVNLNPFDKYNLMSKFRN